MGDELPEEEWYAVMKNRKHHPKIGDVYGVPVDEGKFWCVYTHDHELYGPVLRVLRGVTAEQSFDPANVRPENVLFDVCYSIEFGLKKGLIQFINNITLSNAMLEPPLFREITHDLTTKAPLWWIYKGGKRTRADPSDPRLRKASRIGLINHSGLLQMLRVGWTPEISFDKGWG